MTPERWRHVRELVESTVELGPVERDCLLAARCAGDAALRSEVESLLGAYDAGHTLDRPAFDLGLEILSGGSTKTYRARPSRRPHLNDPILRLSLGEREIAPGDSLGPYRILDEIGQGGMGTVYVAQPEDRKDERVAVKVVQHGLPRQVWRRFRTEYRILAALDHPGIARVLDAGATDDGRPYFVMELIVGTQIEEYCERQGLSAAARLKLILRVCDAIDAAHQRGVVHRDLKPSNILVTANGEPKLLDFGIAKLLDPEAQSITVESTRTNEYPLTPQYASPEQIRVEEITPRTDVYSLGVVLYKLLTGRLPYVLQRYTLVAMEHAFEKQTPSRPSVVGTVRGIDELGAELDTVVMTALSVNVENRFETVDGLARALREILDGRPSSGRIIFGRLCRLRFAAMRWLARFSRAGLRRTTGIGQR